MKWFLGSFFHPRLEWTSQLSPLLGVGEVDKLNVKLRSLNVSGGIKTFPAPTLAAPQTCKLNFSLLTSAQRVSLRASCCRFGPSEAELQAVLPKSVPTNRASGDAVHRPSHHYWILATGGIFFLITSDPKPEHSGREGICVGVPGPALLPRHAGPGREEEGGGLPAQVCHTTPEIPQQQVGFHTTREVIKTGNLSGTQPTLKWLDLDSRAECNW